MSGILFTTLVFIIAIYWFNSVYGPQGINILLIGYLISVLPAIFVHMEYFLKNKNDSIEINIPNSILIINEDQVPFSEIKGIILYMPPAWHRKDIIRAFAFEEYHYAKITFENRADFIFTSLLSTKVEEAVNQLPVANIEKKKRLLASFGLAKLIKIIWY